MTEAQVRESLLANKGWELVLLYEDKEFGCVDATGRVAEHLMRAVPRNVIGIYYAGQQNFFPADLALHRRTKKRRKQ